MITRQPDASVADWPLTERPGFLIRRLQQIHVALFAEACAAFDVTPVQYSLMSALRRRGSADQTTLAEDVSLDRTTATGALKRLEARGFVARATSSADRRAQACRLTSLGLDTLRRMEPSAQRAHRDTMALLPAGDRGLLINLMTRLVAAHDEERSAGSRC